MRQTGRPRSDFEPRESKKNYCCHDWGKLVTPNRNKDFWFRMCNLCQDIEWSP